MKQLRYIILLFSIVLCVPAVSQYKRSFSDSLFNVGVKHYQKGQYETAIANFISCDQYDREFLNEGCARLAYCKMWIGSCFFKMGNVSKAKEYEPSYYMCPPIDRGLTAKSDSLSDIYFYKINQGDYENARYCLLQILEEEIKEIGEENYWVANTLDNCGSDFEKVDSFNLAAHYYNRAYLIRKSVLESNHSDVGKSLLNIAFFYKELKIDSIDALNYYTSGINVLARNSALGNLVCADRIHALAALLSRMGNWESAISYELQSISIMKKVYGTRNKYINNQIARGYHSLMAFNLQAKRYGDAVKYGSRALEMRKELLGESHPYYINTLLSLAIIYDKAGKIDKALEMDSIALNNFKLIENNREYYQKHIFNQLLSNYAYHLKLNKDYSRAIEYYNQLLSGNSHDKSIVMSCKSGLADCYAKIKRFQDAISLEIECLNYYNATGDTTFYEKKTNPFFMLMGYYADAGNIPKVLELCDKGGFYEHLDLEKDDSVDYILLFRHLADLFSDWNHPYESICMKNEVLKKAIEINNISVQLECYSHFAFEYNKLDPDNKNRSISFLKKAIAIAEGSGLENDLDSIDYTELMSQLGAYYSELNDMDSAIHFREKAYLNRLKLKIRGSFDELYFIATYYKEKGDLNNAIEIYERIINYPKEKLISVDSLSYYHNLSWSFFKLFTIYLEKQDAYKQEDIVRRYLSIFSSSRDEHYLTFLRLMTKLLCQHREYVEAIKYGEASINYSKKEYGENSTECADAYHDISLAYLGNGDFDNYINSIQKTISILDSYTIKFSEDYLISIKYNAEFLSNLGLFSKSLDYYNQASEIASELYGEESIQYASIMEDLSYVYTNLGDCAKSIEYQNRALDIREKVQGTDHYQYAHALGELGKDLMRCGNERDGINYLEDCLRIEKNYFGSRSMRVATRLVDICGFYKDASKSINKRDYYEEAYEILKENRNSISSVSDDAIYIKRGLANSLYAERNYAGSSYLLCKMISDLNIKIKESILNVQEQYRQTLWDKYNLLFVRDLPRLAYATKVDSLIEKVFDYSALFGKGLLLNSNNTISQIVAASDSIIKNAYDELIKTKEIKEQELLKPINNRIYEVEDLDEKIRELETSLINSSKDYATYKKNLNITWKDVQAKLSDKDLAVEFYSVQYPDNSSDSIMYFALTLKKEYIHPKLIPLFNKIELPEWDANNSKFFYEYVWMPLEKEMLGVENIYFSTWYSLNNIPIENIETPDGLFVSEIYNMYRLSSTRELVISKSPKLISDIIVFGGLDYENNETEIESNFMASSIPNISLYRGVVDSINSRSGVDYLPYTLIEAKEIAKEAEKSKMNCMILSGKYGTEESFKSISNSGYDIVHIATHGFYYTKEDAERIAKNSNYSFLLHNQDDSESVLYRSFLVMSGGNKLARRDSIPLGTEDGILTAKEISLQNLQNVNLLVLSTCQSGLGDPSSEGVMGLQQGFKKAGVNTIVMSLDYVDDEATKILMVEFYRNLMNGKTKHQSLKDAQKYLRQVDNGKYDKPEYWASFIMLDGLN